MSALGRELLRSKLPPVPPGAGGPPPARRGKRDYTPVKWDQYFQHQQQVEIEGGDTFNVYTAQSQDCPEDTPVVILLHGAGYSGLTWACFVTDFISMVECSVLAIDLRGHGETRNMNEEDLDAQTMALDIGRVYEAIYRNYPRKPPVILVGHSMGGALAVHVAARFLVPEILGLVVIDVVEGTAMDALQGMQNVLRSRPKTFHSLEYAIEWSCRSGQTRNPDAARVSMPAMLKRASDNLPATKLIGTEESECSGESSAPEAGGIPEDEEADFDGAAQPPPSGFTWRINLFKSEPHWEGWFKGLSSKFLGCPCPKLLVLAGIDRLDKDLTIGQMQGKFQTQVLPKVGHAVHEDAPLKVAETIAAYLVRNKLCERIGDFTAPGVSC